MNPILFSSIICLTFSGITSLAQTHVYKDPKIIENNEKSTTLEEKSLRLDQEWKACTTLLENYITALEAKSSTPYEQNEQEFNKRKPPAPMTKKELNFCLRGCEDLLQKELNSPFDPKTLKKQSKEQSISGGLGSCQKAESQYILHIEEYSESQKNKIVDGFRDCPIAMKDLDFDLARLRVIKQKSVCDAKKTERDTTMKTLSEQLDESNKYIINHGMKKIQKSGSAPGSQCD
jgi:hypothetical protein